MENHWVEKWLSLQENPRTRASYRMGMEKFTEFCKDKHFNGLETVVEEHRAARDDDDRRKLQQFIDEWADVLQEYTIWLKQDQNHASASVKTYLAIFQSFFRKYKLPIEVDLPKRIHTEYPKRDLKRETLQLIITRSTMRNRAIYLMLLESGLRPYTVTQIRWWWIKEGQTSFYVATEAAGLNNLLGNSGFFFVLCTPKPKVEVPDLPNVYKLHGKTDLTNLSIALLKAYRNVAPSSKKRGCIGIVSDVLVDFEVKVTRKWVTELVTDLVSKGFTILAVMDPSMHPLDQANAILNLFDGEISLYQTENSLECKKSMRVKRLRNQDYIKNPICITKS